MRLTVLALLLVLMLGCTQQNPIINQTVQNQTVQPIANTTNIPANANPFVISVPITNQTVNATNASVSNQTNITASNITISNQTSNQTMNVTANPQGLVFDDGQYSLVLDDVSLVQTVPCGIFSVRDTNDSIVDRFVICPTQSQIWVAPDGHKFRIRADDVAAGYEKQAMWAQVEIFG